MVDVTRMVKCDCDCCGITIEDISEVVKGKVFGLYVWEHVGADRKTFRQRLKVAWRALMGRPIS